MSGKITDKRSVGRLSLLCAVTYMISYITRTNFAAIISAMESETGISKSLLSIALTGSFIAYGVGQIISGIFADRFSAKKLVAIGLFSSAAMNLIIPLCQNHLQMMAVWSANGLAQAFMWPPIIKILSTRLNDEDYKEATTCASFGSSAGTVFVYLSSPLLLEHLGWRAVFIASAACAVLMGCIWLSAAPENAECGYPSSASSPSGVPTKKAQKGTAFFSPLLLLIMLAIVLQGTLRDGVTTWMPSYVKEVFDFGGTTSILTGVFLPLFSILFFWIAKKCYQKCFRNPMVCAGFFFGAGSAFCVLLLLAFERQAILSVIGLALLTGCMHGVNLILICMIPPFFGKSGKVATVSGILNSCTYVGSALSTYGTALLAEKFGWKFNLYIWLFTALAGAVLCLLCAIPFLKHQMKEKNDSSEQP